MSDTVSSLLRGQAAQSCFQGERFEETLHFISVVQHTRTHTASLMVLKAAQGSEHHYLLLYSAGAACLSV